MKKSIAAAIGQNRRAVLTFGTLLSLAVFSIVAWRTGAVNSPGGRGQNDKQLQADGSEDEKAKKAAKPINSSLDRDDPSLILLNSGSIDTSSDEAKSAGRRLE